MALTYLKKYKEDINLKIQNKAIINFVNANKQNLNGFLLYCIVHYKDSKYNDTVLQEYIKEDFIKWIKEIQAPINKDIMWDFHNFLQENRVFIFKNKGTIKNNIQEQVINVKKEHKQTPQEIEY